MKTSLMAIIILVIATAAVAFDGRCPICKKEGLRSGVFLLGCMRTLMATNLYYDEDGKLNFDDPNITTCRYRCSRGHEFCDNGTAFYSYEKE